jgi:hypothetical protein
MIGVERKRRGYVLIVTLGLLVLAATLMTAVAQTAIRQASAARSAKSELQRRLGVRSIGLFVLPTAEQRLQAAEARLKRPTAILVNRVVLGAQSFVVVTSDEQAKANVSTMLDRANPGAVEAELRRSLSGNAAAELKLRLEPIEPRAPHPQTAPTTQSAFFSTISGFGQMFNRLPVSELMNPRAVEQSPASILTCWGNGAINIRSAPEAAMRLMLAARISPVDIARIIAARDNQLAGKSPAVSQASSVSGATPTAAAAGASAPVDPLRRLLTSAGVAPSAAGQMMLGSSCHSVWIIAQSNGRQWYHLYIRDESDPNKPQTISARW